MITLDIFLSNGRLRVGFGLGCSRSARIVQSSPASLDRVKKDIDDVKKLDANEIFFMIFPTVNRGLFAAMELYRSLV